jgi:hypothetical protein
MHAEIAKRLSRAEERECVAYLRGSRRTPDQRLPRIRNLNVEPPVDVGGTCVRVGARHVVQSHRRTGGRGERLARRVPSVVERAARRVVTVARERPARPVVRTARSRISRVGVERRWPRQRLRPTQLADEAWVARKGAPIVGANHRERRARSAGQMAAALRVADVLRDTRVRRVNGRRGAEGKNEKAEYDEAANHKD